MNKKLMAGFAAVGVLAGGAGAAALLAGGGAVPARATTATAAYATPTAPCAGSALSSLVRSGTISQAQATAVQNALRTYMRGHFGWMDDHASGMRQHMGDMRGHMRTVLRQLVNKGTITNAQATAIASTITHQMTAWHGHGAGMMGGRGAGMMSGGHMGWAAAGSPAS